MDGNMSENAQKQPESVRPQRDERGCFLPGNTIGGDPLGKLKGSARWERIVQYYRENFTVNELKALATNMDKLGRMKVEYAEVIVHLAGSLAGKGRRGERESLYNRLWGTPVQTVVTREENVPLPEDSDKMTPEEAKRAHELLLKD